MSRRAACLVGLALVVSGCGYALAGRGSFLPADIQVVAIPQLQNQSTFFNVEQVLTDKLRAEMIGRGKYRVVPDTTGADAALTGVVTGISLTPTALSDQTLASRYQFTMTMKVEFTDLRTNMVIWSNDALTFRGEYDVETRGGTLEGSSFVDQASSSFDRIATDAARSVVTAILEAF